MIDHQLVEVGRAPIAPPLARFIGRATADGAYVRFCSCRPGHLLFVGRDLDELAQLHGRHLDAVRRASQRRHPVAFDPTDPSPTSPEG